MIVIEKVRRGCGEMEEGGSYAIGRVGTGGTLATFAWLLRATPFEVPPRRIEPVLASDLASEPWIEFPLPRTNGYVLLDHVGADAYSVYQFAEECARLGPSRRINPYGWPEDVQPPLPILFTHDEAVTADAFGMSLPYKAIIELFGEKEAEELDWTNTWEHPEFGYEVDLDGSRPYAGWSHPMVDVYQHFIELKKARKYSEFIRKHNILFEEGIFGASWITNLVYVLGDGEEEAPADIAARGFEAARLEDEETDE